MFTVTLQFTDIRNAEISMLRDNYPLKQSKTVILRRIETQSFNPGEYLGKQPFVYRNLRHLKRDISAVSDDLRPNLDEFDEETAEGPVLDFSWKHQTSQKVSQVIGQNE